MAQSQEKGQNISPENFLGAALTFDWTKISLSTIVFFELIAEIIYMLFLVHSFNIILENFIL